MKNKSFFSRVLENKKLVIVVSLLLSFMFWIISSDNTSKTINNIALEHNLPESVASELKVFGLEKIDGVTVEVAGKRVIIEDLEASDLTASVDLSGITAPVGETSFEITVDESSSGYEISSIEPATVKLIIDEEISKDVTIISDLSYSPSDYYVSNNIPETVKVSGPKSIITQIKSAYVHGKVTKPANGSTVENTFSVELYTTDNVYEISDANRISADTMQYINMSFSNVKVNFNFLKIAENVPFSIDYTPSGLNLSSSYFEIIPSTITVAGPDSVINDEEPLESIPIDIGSLSQYSNKVYSQRYSIYDEILKPIDENLLNETQGVETVQVQLDFSSLSSATFEVPVSNINVKNLDKNFTYTPSSSYAVTVIGTASALENLQAEDIRIVYDFKNATPADGSNYLNAQVDITIDSTELCWAYRTSEVSTVIVSSAD